MHLVKLLNGLSANAHHSCRDTYRSRIIRNIRKHYGTCGNFYVVADFNGTENLRTCTDKHVVAKGWVTFADILPRTTQRYALIDDTVVPYLRRLTDNNACTVVDKKAFANRGCRMNFNSRFEFTTLTYISCLKKATFFIGFMRASLHAKRPKALIKKEYLKIAFCGGVMLFYKI